MGKDLISAEVGWYMLYKWIAIINLSIVSTFLFLGQTLVSPILYKYAAVFDVPIAMTGWAISSYALARVLIDFPAGIIGYRYGEKGIMLAGIVLVALSSAVTALAPNFLVFVLSRVSAGLGSALYLTNAGSLLAKISSGPNRGKIMSIWSGMIFFGMATGPVVSGFLAAYYGIQAPFFFFTLLCIAAIVVTIFLDVSSQEEDVQVPYIGWKDLIEVLSSRRFILVNFAVFAAFFLRDSVRNTLLPLYASVNLGLSEDRVGILMAAVLVGTGVLTFPAGWLSDKIERRIPVMVSMLSSALLSLLIPFQNSMDSLLVLCIVFGFVLGLQGPILALVADFAPSNRMAVAMGIFRLYGDLGSFVGPISVTYLNNFFNPDLIGFQAFTLPISIAVLAALLLTRLKRPIDS